VEHGEDVEGPLGVAGVEAVEARLEGVAVVDSVGGAAGRSAHFFHATSTREVSHTACTHVLLVHASPQHPTHQRWLMTLQLPQIWLILHRVSGPEGMVTVQGTISSPLLPPSSM